MTGRWPSRSSNFDKAFIVIFAVPIRASLIIASYQHRWRLCRQSSLAVHHLKPLFKMVDNVFGNQPYAFPLPTIASSLAAVFSLCLTVSSSPSVTSSNSGSICGLSSSLSSSLASDFRRKCARWRHNNRLLDVIDADVIAKYCGCAPSAFQSAAGSQ